jgi:hypothetical protein
MYRTAADKVDAMDLIKVAKVDNLVFPDSLGELESWRAATQSTKHLPIPLSPL